MKKIYFILLLVGWFGLVQAQAQISAFPGAEGFGAIATGGRGGNVYVVTNLNDRGAGSFREAVSQSNRIVVFAVGGVINISDAISVSSNVTIAGQTAPGEGITVYGNQVHFGNNVICRYMRFHGSINMPSSRYTLSATNSKRVMFDHVSVMWGRWDNMKLDGGSENITFQYCLIGEAILPQKLGALFETPNNVTVHHSLWINNKSRNPKAKANIEYINNVVYNWGSDAFVLGHSSARFNQDVIGNFFLAGPSSSTGNPFITQGGSNDLVFQADNYGVTAKNGTLDGRLLTDSDVRGAPTSSVRYFRDNRVAPFPVTIDSNLDAFHKVVAKAGASKHRGAVDLRLINQVKSYGREGALITREGDVGGQPPMEGGIPAKDSNNTGIPDWWAEAMGFGTDATLVWSKEMRSDGYTQLEHYINSIVTAGAPDVEIDGITAISGVVNDDPFTEGSVTNSQNLKIYGTATAGATVLVSRIDLDEPLGTATADDDGNWEFDYSATALPERYYAFTARVQEGEKHSLPSIAYPVRVQITPSEKPEILRMTTLPDKTFSGVTVPYGTVNVFIQGSDSPIATGKADGYGNWNATTTEEFDEQEYNFVASTVELSGVTTALSEPFQVNMAIQTPAVTAIAPVTGDQTYPQITSAQQLTFTGNAQPDNIIQLYYLFNDGTTTTNIGSATADGSGNWTLNATNRTLAEGIYTFMATADAGNTPSPMSAPFIVDIDRTRPTVANIRRLSPDATATASSTIVFRVTFSEPVSGVTMEDFSVTRSGTTMTGNITAFARDEDDAGTYYVTVTDAAGDGTIRVDLRASRTNIVDRAGNQCNAAFTSGQTYTMRIVGSGVWIEGDIDGYWSDVEMWDNEDIADGVGATADFTSVDLNDQHVATLDQPVQLGRLIFTDADEESPGTWRIASTDPGNAITLGYTGATVPEIRVTYDNDDSGLDYNKSAKGRNNPAIIEAPIKSTRGFTKTGWGTLELREANEISGAITVTQGTIRVGPGGSLQMDNTMTLSTAGCAFYVNGGAFSTNSTFTMNFSSESKLVVSGGTADFKRIVSSNDRNGEIRISGGVMTADEIMIQRNSDASISRSSGFFVSGGDATIGNLGIATNNSWGYGSVSSGKLTVTGALTIGWQATGGRGGELAVSGGEIIASGNDGIVISRRHSGGNANNSATLVITGGTVTAKRIALGYDSQVTAGSGTLTLNGSNATIYLGSLGLVKNGNFTTNVNMNNGTLGADENWSTTVPMSIGGNGLRIKAANAANAARNITIGGVLSGSNGFTKNGAGTLTLTAANTYTGATIISEGTLQIGSGGRIQGAVTAQANAILAGAGNANGTVTASANAIIHPGAESPTTAVTLNINNLTVNSAILRFNLFSNNISDRINLAGTFTKNGTNIIDVNILEPGLYNLGKLGSLNDATVTVNGQPVDGGQYSLYNCNSDLYLAVGTASIDAELPNISGHPQGATVYVGDDVNLSVAANVTDGGNMSYQWYSNTLNNSENGTLINGATNVNYSPTTATAETTYYYVVVTNTHNCVNGSKTVAVASNTAAVTVVAIIDAQVPDISEHPQDATVYIDDAITLTVSAAVTDEGILSYQWFSNAANSNSGGTDLGEASGAQTDTYTPPTTTVGTMYYYVEVTNTNNAVYGAKTATAVSDAAMVKVNPSSVTSVTVDPTVVTVKKGGTQQFTANVTVIGNASTEVTWTVTGNRYSTTTVNENGLLTVAAGETAATITITARSVFDETKYGSATVTIENITAVDEFYVPDLNVYPNPFTGTVCLTGAGGYTLQVMNVAGAVVHTQKIESHDEMLRLEHLPASVYVFRLVKDGKSTTVNIVKE